jgi:hypothetical protein
MSQGCDLIPHLLLREIKFLQYMRSIGMPLELQYARSTGMPLECLLLISLAYKYCRNAEGKRPMTNDEALALLQKNGCKRANAPVSLICAACVWFVGNSLPNDWKLVEEGGAAGAAGAAGNGVADTSSSGASASAGAGEALQSPVEPLLMQTHVMNEPDQELSMLTEEGDGLDDFWRSFDTVPAGSPANYVRCSF